MGSNSSTNKNPEDLCQSYGLKYGNKNKKNFKELNIYPVGNNQIIKRIEESFKKDFPEYKLKFWDKNYNDLKPILNEIENKYMNKYVSNKNNNNDILDDCQDEYFSNKSNYNIILEILNNVKNIEEEKKKISDCLGEIKYAVIRPTVVLGCKNMKEQAINNNNKYNKERNIMNYSYTNNRRTIPNNYMPRPKSAKKERLMNSDISNEYIKLVYFKDDDETAPSEIIEKIKQLYRYYNNIGDIYTIINEMLEQPEFSKNDDKNDDKYRYPSTLNILVIGRSGGGKSTLINILLNEKEKRAHTGSMLFGLSNTKLFSRYIHQKYPITFIDTPGIERKEDFERMKNYLSETKKLFGDDGKNKIHSILYIINSSEPRYFNYNEKSLIEFIKEKNIQIFFVCTRSEDEMNALNREEFIKVNLKQIFGKKTTLADKIFSCQLLDEKDGIYKSFGIDKLLKGIYEFFKETELKNLEDISNYILSNQNNIFNQLVEYDENNNYNQSDPIFLTSLKKHNNNFEKYLNTLCDDIINYYANKINNSRLQNNEIIEGIKMLIKHLAYELDINLPYEEINRIIFDSNTPQKNDFSFHLENGINERIKEVGNKAKAILLERLQTKYIERKKERSQSKMKALNPIDKYFYYLIKSYIKAINSLEKLYK